MIALEFILSGFNFGVVALAIFLGKNPLYIIANSIFGGFLLFEGVSDVLNKISLEAK